MFTDFPHEISFTNVDNHHLQQNLVPVEYIYISFFSVTRCHSLQVATVIVVTLVEQRLIVKKIQNLLAEMPKVLVTVLLLHNTM